MLPSMRRCVLRQRVAPLAEDIEVAVEVTADAVVITVADSGPGIQPRSDSPGLGLGLPLIASLTQRFDVEQRPEGGTRLMLWFDRT